MFADIRSPLLRKNTSGFYPVRKDWHMEKAIKKYFPVFALPTLVAFAVFFIVPFVVGIYLSFCEFTTITDAHFVGLDNYIKFMQDKINFYKSRQEFYAFNASLRTKPDSDFSR